MEIQEQVQGAVRVLKPIGPLIGVDTATFRDVFTRVAKTAASRLVVDASAVPFIDSVGIEALVDMTDQLGTGGRSLKLCGANPTLRQVLDLTGWSGAFEFYDDVTSGVRSFL